MRAVMVALPVLLALAGCGGRDLSPDHVGRVAVPIPGEDPLVQRGNTQQPIDASTIPGVTGR